MKWTPPTNFEEVQIAMEEMYKQLKGENGSASTQATIPALKTGYKYAIVDTFGDLVDENDETVNIPENTNIFNTSSERVIPSSYFLDLRGTALTTKTWQITADWAVVHDKSSPWKTISITSVNATVNIDTAGPIANGRDQSAAFASTWIHFFIIYDPSSRVIASLASLSATSPNLPDGYDYFVKVGSSYVTAAGSIVAVNQIMNNIWHAKNYLNMEPATADLGEALDISLGVPTTAKVVFGYAGNSANIVGQYGMWVASYSPNPLDAFVNVLQTSSPVIVGYSPANAFYFRLTIRTAQTIYWAGSATNPYFAICINGYEDDI